MLIALATAMVNHDPPCMTISMVDHGVLLSTVGNHGVRHGLLLLSISMTIDMVVSGYPWRLTLASHMLNAVNRRRDVRGDPCGDR